MNSHSITECSISQRNLTWTAGIRWKKTSMEVALEDQVSEYSPSGWVSSIALPSLKMVLFCTLLLLSDHCLLAMTQTRVSQCMPIPIFLFLLSRGSVSAPPKKTYLLGSYLRWGRDAKQILKPPKDRDFSENRVPHFSIITLLITIFPTEIACIEFFL